MSPAPKVRVTGCKLRGPGTRSFLPAAAAAPWPPRLLPRLGGFLAGRVRCSRGDLSPAGPQAGETRPAPTQSPIPPVGLALRPERLPELSPDLKSSGSHTRSAHPNGPACCPHLGQVWVGPENVHI